MCIVTKNYKTQTNKAQCFNCVCGDGCVKDHTANRISDTSAQVSGPMRTRAQQRLGTTNVIWLVDALRGRTWLCPRLFMLEREQGSGSQASSEVERSCTYLYSHCLYTVALRAERHGWVRFFKKRRTRLYPCRCLIVKFVIVVSGLIAVGLNNDFTCCEFSKLGSC